MSEGSFQECIADNIELYKQAKFQDAEAGFFECVKSARALVASPKELIDALSGQATVYFVLSKFAEAQKALEEALSLIPSDSSSFEWQTVKACLLNDQARIFAELEQPKDVEEILLKAIGLVESVHPVYAAEFHANLVKVMQVIPHWRHKIKHHADEFDRLQAIGEKLEVYFDDMAVWRRPGMYWDITGTGSPESLQARSLTIHIKHLYANESDAKDDYESILRLDAESKQVPPHIVAQAYLGLAGIASHGGDLISASKYCEECLRVVSSSYLSVHPSSYLTLLTVATYVIFSGKLDQSRALLESAKKLVGEALGVESPAYAKCLSFTVMLSPAISGAGTDSASKQLIEFRQCRDILQRFFPDSHSTVFEMNLLIIKALVDSGQFDEAEKLLTETSQNAQNNQIDSISKQCACLTIFANLRIKQGRTSEVEGALKMSESLLEQQEGLLPEKKVRDLDNIGKQFISAGLFVEGERIYRKCVDLTASMSADLKQNAKQHLALCLMRIGKAGDAADLLGNIGETTPGDKKLSRREELVAQSHLAWGLQAKRRFGQAKVLATEVVNDAHLLMPECEEALVIALSVLMEQAKSENQPDEMLRLIGILGGHENSVRLRATLPILYLEAAQLYAKQKSIKAEALFQKSIKYAEDIHPIVPHCLDGSVLAYMNYCAANRKNEAALKLCERLVALRTVSNGTSSLEYAVAVTAQARLLAESNPTRAEVLSLEAFNILESMTDPTTRVQLLVTVSVREGILKKLLMFDESAKMAARSLELRAELDSQIAALKASRELQK